MQADKDGCTCYDETTRKCPIHKHMPHNSNYNHLDNTNRKKLITQCLKDNMSIKAIAEAYSTYPNKVRRDAKKLGIIVPNKSQAQKSAIESGRHPHPTQGKKRSQSTKIKISDGKAKDWEECSNIELERRAEISRINWNKKTPDELETMRRNAQQKIRETITQGSKLERYLFEQMIQRGYRVEFHKDNMLPNEKLQVDLYLPEINTVVEVDGPSHFEEIWGKKSLIRNQTADQNKNATLLSMGLYVVRVRQTQKISDKYKRDVWKKVKNILNKINTKSLKERYLEL